MFCDTTQFHSLPFCGPHAKPHGVQGLRKNYNMQIYTKLVHVTCGIGDNMDLLVQACKYVSMNPIYTTKLVYYVVMYVSEAYTLQEETACDGKFITYGELFVKAQYPRFM